MRILESDQHWQPRSSDWETPEMRAPVSIKERIQLAPQFTLIRFNESLPSGQPGQYCMVWIPRFDEKPFMISNTSPLEIVVQTRDPSGPLGQFSKAITNANFSEKIFIRGPLGTGFSLPENHTSASTIFIDNTAGLSAARFLLPTLVSKGKSNIKLFLNAEFFSVFPPDVLNYFPYQTYTSPQLEEVLRAALPLTEYLYCSTVTENIIQIIQQIKEEDPSIRLSSAQILSVNHYIACSMGICGRCSENFAESHYLAGKLPCVEGPVFDVLKLN